MYFLVLIILLPCHCALSLPQHNRAGFGEVALLNPGQLRTATIITRERTEMLLLNKDSFVRELRQENMKKAKRKIDYISSCYLFKKLSNDKQVR